MNLKPNDAVVRYIDACFSQFTHNEIPDTNEMDMKMNTMLHWHGGAIIRY